MRYRVTALIAISLAACGAHAYDFSGNDWKFNLQGRFNVVNIDAKNVGAISVILGKAFNLAGQLNLMNGTTSAINYRTSITQSGLSVMSLNDLRVNVALPSGLTPRLNSFLTNLLNPTNGIFNGSVVGANVVLNRSTPPINVLPGLIDTRILGTGVVLDLQARVSSATLRGELTVLKPGLPGPFGPRAATITGSGGLAGTATVQVRAATYVAGIPLLDTGYVNVGVLENSVVQWNLSR